MPSTCEVTVTNSGGSGCSSAGWYRSRGVNNRGKLPMIPKCQCDTPRVPPALRSAFILELQGTSRVPAAPGCEGRKRRRNLCQETISPYLIFCVARSHDNHNIAVSERLDEYSAVCYQCEPGVKCFCRGLWYQPSARRAWPC